MKKTEFLKKLIDTQSPTGYETGGVKVWLDYMSKYCDTSYTDAYGSAIALIKSDVSNPIKVVIEAHCDEISWIVNHIDSNGYLSVVRNGGSDHQVAPGQRVNIMGNNGNVRGVFGWLAIHERRGEKTINPETDKLYVDIGAKTKEEVLEMGIEVGCPLTYSDGFEILNNQYYIGRALDNRIGGYMIAQVAKKIKDNKIKLPFDLYIVNAVQEEIGLRGAKMVAESLKPDIAIITDVCHDAHSPLYNVKSVGDVKCGNGGVVFRGADVQRNLLKLIRETADKNKIPYQVSTYNGNSGTDTSAFYVANGGTPSALISLPLKYMHTSVEMVDKDDVKSVINLIYNFLINLPNNPDLNYLS